LAGLAIVLGIPFPVWIYYKGEQIRAKNPLTSASVKKGRPVSATPSAAEAKESIEEKVSA
jgi:hypothetical protein